MCVEFIASVTGGLIWEKSACKACPFALDNKAGRERVLQRYADSPAAGVDTLFMEHVALTLNPAQTVLSGKSAKSVVEAVGVTAVLEGLEGRLDETEHAIYEVRRILRARKDDPTKMANASRAVTAIASGTREEMAAELAALAVELDTPAETDAHGIDRIYVRTRAELFPTVEQFYVVCPAVVKDKQDAKFETWWSDLLDGAPVEALAA